MNGDRMSPESLEAISAAQSARAISVSPISAWEIATLVARGRLALTRAPEAWFSALLHLPGIGLAPMPPAILMASATLPGTPPRDPADRIIVATARTCGDTIITRDQLLLAYAAAGHVDALAC